MTAFQRWLDHLPTTNFKSFLFYVLTIATFFLTVAGMALATFSRHKPDDVAVSIFNSWLIFLGAFGGLSLGQFLAKRATYQVPSPDSVRAGIVEPPQP